MILLARSVQIMFQLVPLVATELGVDQVFAFDQ